MRTRWLLFILPIGEEFRAGWEKITAFEWMISRRYQFFTLAFLSAAGIGGPSRCHSSGVDGPRVRGSYQFQLKRPCPLIRLVLTTGQNNDSLDIGLERATSGLNLRKLERVSFCGCVLCMHNGHFVDIYMLVGENMPPEDTWRDGRRSCGSISGIRTFRRRLSTSLMESLKIVTVGQCYH